MMMRLPGEPQTEFFLMLPMTPSQRENMIAWLAARCDPPEYGKLIVYEFPKDKLVYGPFRSRRSSTRTPRFRSRSRCGIRWLPGHSRESAGRPHGASILYVSPLYLRAQSGQLPELKRVIAAYGERVVMEETLPAALAALFKDPPRLRACRLSGPFALGPADQRARGAFADYNRAIDRLKAGIGRFRHGTRRPAPTARGAQPAAGCTLGRRFVVRPTEAPCALHWFRPRRGGSPRPARQRRQMSDVPGDAP